MNGKRFVTYIVCGCLMATYLLVRKTDVFGFLDGDGGNLSYLDIVERVALFLPFYVLACYHMESGLKNASLSLHRNRRVSAWWINQQREIVFGILVCYISMAVVLFAFGKIQISRDKILTIACIVSYALWLYSLGVWIRMRTGSMPVTVIGLIVFQVVGMGVLDYENTFMRYNPTIWSLYGYMQSLRTKLGYSIWIVFFIELICVCYNVLLLPYLEKENILRRISDEKNG